MLCMLKLCALLSCPVWHSQTGPNTTLEQLYEMYPDLEAEIEEEIAAHEWGKDI